MANREIRFPNKGDEYQWKKNRKKVIQNGTVCAICGGYVNKELPRYHPMSAEADHIVPVSRGGHPTSLDNLQLTHRKCNLAKSNKMPEVQAEETERGIDPESWVNWK